MHKIRILSVSFLVSIAMVSCQKDNHPPLENEEVVDEIIKTPLIRAIEWDNGNKAEMSYNEDSTLRAMDYTQSDGAKFLTNYAWISQQLNSKDVATSTIKTIYNHAGGKIISASTEPKDGRQGRKYRYDYSYLTNGKLAETINWNIMPGMPPSELLRTEYKYDATGSLDSIIVYRPGGRHVTRMSIDGFSEEVSFDPIVLAGPALEENTFIYNYPLLSQLNRLPSKVTARVEGPNQQWIIESIEEYEFTITNKRLDKKVVTITSPGWAFSRTLTTSYRY